MKPSDITNRLTDKEEQMKINILLSADGNEYEYDLSDKDAVSFFDVDKWKSNGNKFTEAQIPNSVFEAAPDLLKTLKNILSHNNSLKEMFKLEASVIRDIEAAISKAEGAQCS